MGQRQRVAGTHRSFKHHQLRRGGRAPNPRPDQRDAPPHRCSGATCRDARIRRRSGPASGCPFNSSAPASALPGAPDRCRTGAWRGLVPQGPLGRWKRRWSTSGRRTARSGWATGQPRGDRMVHVDNPEVGLRRLVHPNVNRLSCLPCAPTSVACGGIVPQNCGSRKISGFVSSSRRSQKISGCRQSGYSVLPLSSNSGGYWS